MIMKTLITEKLNSNYNDAIIEIVEHHGEITFIVKKEEIEKICRFLKTDDDLRFIYLVDICGSDRFVKENRFEVIYNLWSEKLKFRIRLKVRVDENDIFVDSVTGVWKAANWYERETYDMFGVVFKNHPDMRRIYMPEEFEYYPLRKDFPLMGVPDSLQLPRRNS